MRLVELDELRQQIGRLAMAMSNPAVRADMLKAQTIESQTVARAVEILEGGVLAPGLRVKVDTDGAVWLVFLPYNTLINIRAFADRNPDSVIGQQLILWVADRIKEKAFGGTSETPGRIDLVEKRLEMASDISELITKYTNKVLELGGSDVIDADEVPLILADFVRELGAMR